MVVSEETGIISVADGGQLTREFDRESLTEFLTQHYLGRQAPGAEEPAAAEEEGDLQGRSTTRIVRRKVSS